MSKKKIDKRTLLMVKAMPLGNLKDFLEKFYEEAFRDGANADVDPNIKYMVIKKGVKYECGCCGAELHFDQEEGESDETN